MVGQGTDPGAPDPSHVTARVPSGNGMNVGAWVVGIIAALIAAVYGFGLLS